jgi:integrase
VARVADVLAEYKAAQRSRGLAEGTITAREYQLRSWMAFVPDPWRATPSDVRAWIGQRPQGPNARYGMISHLHRFYVWAIGEGYGIEDPTLTVERPKRPRRLPRPTPAKDFLLAVQTASDPLLRAWILLAGFCGLRCVELARLVWRDIDLEQHPRLRVVGKGNRERAIPLHPDVVQALLDLPRSGDYIAGKAITASAVSQRINRHLHQHGLTSTAHQLRHMAATMAYEGDRDIIAVQRLLGHASVDTTTIYTDIDDSAVRHAVESEPTLAELAARERHPTRR